MSLGIEKRMDPVQYHSQLADEWEQRYRRSAFQARKDALLACLESEDLAGKNWLDAGCGTGTLSRLLSERGSCVIGVDASAEMLQAARTLSEKSANSATLSFDHVADLARLPFADSAFAGVLCSSVLEYLSAPDAALAEFARVLRPGGMLVISVPNRHALSRKVQVVCRSLGKRFGCEWFNYLQISRNWYADAEFRHCLKAHGMTGERQATFGGPFSRSIHQSPMWGSLIMFAARRK